MILFARDVFPLDFAVAFTFLYIRIRCVRSHKKEYHTSRPCVYGTSISGGRCLLPERSCREKWVRAELMGRDGDAVPCDVESRPAGSEGRNGRENLKRSWSALERDGRGGPVEED